MLFFSHVKVTLQSLLQDSMSGVAFCKRFAYSKKAISLQLREIGLLYSGRKETGMYVLTICSYSTSFGCSS